LEFTLFYGRRKMMKNILVFVLVLAIASTANAVLTLQLIDNGNGTFGIASTTAYAGIADDTFYCAVGPAATAPSGGAVQAGAPAATTVLDDAVAVGGIPVPAGTDGVWGYIGDPFGVPVPAGTYIDGVSFTPGDIIDLYLVTATWQLGALVSTIPEPITIALLGLGGLFLRRRR
jgi:hypothetical protein